MGFIKVAIILVFALLGGVPGMALNTPTVPGFVGWVILAALLYMIVESVRTWFRLRQALYLSHPHSD